MPTALRLPRNRPCRHGIVYVLLASWLALLVSGSCAVLFRTSPEAMPACPESQAPDKEPVPTPDCSLKVCLASPLAPGLAVEATAPELPPVVLYLAWALDGWLRPILRLRIPGLRGPPPGRPAPLIYRFCTLLN